MKLHGVVSVLQTPFDSDESIGKRLESVAPAWYEDPIPHSDPRGMVEVARRVNVPVGTGESLTTKQ